MQVKNKYIRYQEEVRETQNGEKSGTPVQETGSAPATPPSSPSLAEVERPKPITRIPLPGGGFRNLDYKGPLSLRELDRVQELHPVYKEAENKTKVSWKILAGIHYRESALGLDGKAKGNEFQFDGALSGRADGNLLHDMVQAGETLQEKSLNGLYSNKAKKWLVEPAEALSPDQTESHNVKTAVFLYNGPIYRKKAAPGMPSYDRSPYTLNRLDKKHWDMDLYRGKHAHPRWGTDHRLGVIPFARELGKAFED